MGYSTGNLNYSNDAGSQPQAGTANPVGTPNIAPAVVAVTSAGQLLAAARPGGQGVGRVYALISNNGANTIYVGNSGVTTANGFAIPAGQSQGFDTQAALYAIAATGSNNVSVLETF